MHELGVLLQPGDRIWRDVILHDPGGVPPPYEISAVKLPPSDRGGAMFRARWESVVVGRPPIWRVVEPDLKSGFVCFCNHVLPPDWTYFVAQRLSKNATSCVVVPVAGSRSELLWQYGVGQERTRGDR
jgi:hypothetical protein